MDEISTKALALINEHMGEEAARKLRKKIEDAGHIEVIRDAFLEGKDREAITMICDLDPWARVNEGEFRVVPVFTHHEVMPGESVMVTARPQSYAFKPITLMVSNGSAGFLINDIRVGNRSMFMQAGSIPADLLMPIPPELEYRLKDESEPTSLVIKAETLSRAIVPMDMEICMTAMDLTLALTNDSPQPRMFRGMFLGKMISEPQLRSVDHRRPPPSPRPRYNEDRNELARTSASTFPDDDL